jgi:hypothetical protein
MDRHDLLGPQQSKIKMPQSTVLVPSAAEGESESSIFFFLAVQVIVPSCRLKLCAIHYTARKRPCDLNLQASCLADGGKDESNDVGRCRR